MKKILVLSMWLACSGVLGSANVVLAEEVQNSLVAQEQPIKVNINQADAETLAQGLDGIGPAKAQAIVQYREAKGGFIEVDEILEVRGIGVATLERNRERMVIE